MLIFLATLKLLSIAFAVHLGLWQVWLPKRQTVALLGLFIGCLGVWLVAPSTRLVPVEDVLHTALFYLAICLAYIVTYSAIESDSPTLSLMYFLAKKGAEGCSFAEMKAFFARNPFVQSRVDSLLQSGLIKKENGRYFITGTPSLPFRLILGFRKIYGEVGKGG